jgi:hypothetical protein
MELEQILPQTFPSHDFIPDEFDLEVNRLSVLLNPSCTLVDSLYIN